MTTAPTTVPPTTAAPTTTVIDDDDRDDDDRDDDRPGRSRVEDEVRERLVELCNRLGFDLPVCEPLR